MPNNFSEARLHQFYYRYKGDDQLFHILSYYNTKLDEELINKLYNILVLNLIEVCKHCLHEYITNSNLDKILLYKYPSFLNFTFTLEEMVEDWKNRNGFIQPLIGTIVNNNALLSEGRHRILIVNELNKRNEFINPSILCVYKNTFDGEPTNIIIPKELLDTIYPYAILDKLIYDDFSYICKLDSILDIEYVYFMFLCELDYAFEYKPEIISFEVDKTIINKYQE